MSLLNLTPRPLRINVHPGKFTFGGAGLEIQIPQEFEAFQSRLQRLFPTNAGHFSGSENSLKVRLALIHENHLNEEFYKLKISEKEILIESPTGQGLAHGLSTLSQLIPPSGYPFDIPCVSIEDEPRFAWRGLMIDESRHFFGKETVKTLLEAMSLFKLNVFHWHLTDDQGWRIQSNRYPRLTEVGAWRNSESLSLFGKPDGKLYGGFYSQDEIREIVSFASLRGITVIPEIDVPGHSTAAIAAYPEISCTGQSTDVTTHIGLFQNILCPGREETFEFIDNLMDEILPLFPGPYVHIGGDEVNKSKWKECPLCQRRIHSEGLRDEEELQTYFINRVNKILAGHGKVGIGWHEINHPNVDKNFIIQYWNLPGNRKKITPILSNGHKMINSSFTHAYLSHGYAFSPLKKVYDFDPVPGFAQPFAPQIIGFETALFSEHVTNPDNLWFKLFPRLVAFAESGWSVNRDYEDFTRRLPIIYEQLRGLGISPAPISVLNPPVYQQLFSIFNRHG